MIQVQHVFREANIATDYLAKWAVRMELDVRELEAPLQEMLAVLKDDARGKEFPCTGGGLMFRSPL